MKIIKLLIMKTWINTPTKKQVILICSITAFLFLRLSLTTDFFTTEKFSNRQYLIFGIIMSFGFVLSTTAIILYQEKKSDKAK